MTRIMSEHSPQTFVVTKESEDTWELHTIKDIHSPLLKRNVDIDVFLPPDYQKEHGPFPLLLLNDGQDSEGIKLKSTLDKLYKAGKLRKFIVVGVYCGDRMQEYGVASKPDYMKRGARAKLYTKFILGDLLPYLQFRYAIESFSSENVIAGYSLGGLSALDIAWNNPQYFRRAGAFSGSFWWRKRDLQKGYTDKDRLMHAEIRDGKFKPGMKFWFQAGTLDERADRNNNGIIDAIDDTLDVISELIKKGYKPYYDVVYHEMKDGEHNQKTWSEAMPVFLEWAFGK